ncbi:iron ABC transporter substrate-binding protein [Primorskyibacter flagellatus]|uniref:Iron complex transport system substrate-binding protein n=1 Tax=Primorskyibacter flagellatus TaxID=1387277 RepID=A0A1W2CDI8_9RHOB|nr:iron ABC transporter substrate-binding protein [Primorskyibacter flagellatus]SMC83044.1 iron complex transport system substrate-binding protein [Primorskyibacter flagellatus]
MRFLLIVLALLALPASARTVVDSAGRTVEIPDEVNTVFAAGPPAAILVYTMKPEALTGWPRALRPEEQDYIAEPYRDLPETGRITGRGGEANLERVLQIKPDLIIDFGSVRDTYIDLANRVQEQTGIPYLLIDGRFENTAAAMRIVGEALGVPERGEALATDVEATFKRIDAMLADVPEEERPRVYLARGPDGLETGMKGSINTEIIERAGGRNVADDGGATRGLVQSSIEQVIVANPDTIVTWDPNFYSKVFDDPLWQGIDALRDGRVHLSPTAPFGWIDRPPSVNRMMGLIWMAGLLYPERWDGDLREDTRAFYKLYYHVDLSDEELGRLLEWTQGRSPM